MNSILVSSLDGVSLSTPVNEDFGDFVKAEANHDIYDSRWKEKEEKESLEYIQKLIVSLVFLWGGGGDVNCKCYRLKTVWVKCAIMPQLHN